MANLDTFNGKFGTIVHCFPNMRVLIYGAEVKEVSSVQFNSELNRPSTITITIISPRNRFIITKNDLLGRWRDDKTIATDKVSGVTQMVYETKLRSGLAIPEGEPIYGVRDPVRVFLRGRYTNDWYLAFTGLINKPATITTFGNAQNISLLVEDVSRLLRTSFSDVNPSVSFASRAILINRRNPEVEKAEIGFYDSVMVGKKLVDIVDYLITGSPLSSTVQAKVDANKSELKEAQELVDTHRGMYIQLEEELNTIKAMETNIIESYSSSGASEAEINERLKELHDQKVTFQGELDSYERKWAEAKADLLSKTVTRLQISEDVITGSDKIGGCGFFRKVHNLYKNISDPLSIYKRFGVDVNVERWFPYEYDYTGETGNYIFPTASVEKNALNPVFSKSEIDLMAGSLSKVHKLSLESQWEKTIISPDMIIKGEVEGLWLYSVMNELYNPRFILVAQKDFAEGKTTLQGAVRTLRLAGNEIRSKLTLMYQGLNNIDFNFNATTCGDLLCEPFWDNTNPHDWHELLRKENRTYIDGVEGDEEWKSLGSKRGALEGDKTDRNYYYMSFRKNIDSPFVVEDKETFSKNWSIAPDNIQTYITVQGDCFANAAIKLGLTPEQLFLSSMDNLRGLAFGWYAADGFKGQLISEDDVNTIKNFEDLKKFSKYEAETDLVREFGFNEFKKTTMLTDDSESSKLYAEMLFKRFLGDAFIVPVSHAYKPEMMWWLGKPVFIREAKVIGVLRKVAFNFAFGQEMRFTTELYRVRRQRFRYSQDLLPYTGDEFYKKSETFVQNIDTTEGVEDIGIFPRLGVANLEKLGLVVARQAAKETIRNEKVMAELTLFDSDYSLAVSVNYDNKTFVRMEVDLYKNNLHSNGEVAIAQELEKYNKSKSYDDILSYIFNISNTLDSLNIIELPIDAYDREGNFDTSFIKVRKEA